MTLIVDASVVLKTLFDEPGTPEARAFMSGAQIAAPDLLLTECANVLWVQARRANITTADAAAGLAAIEALPISILPSGPLAGDALRIALDIDQTVYDCLYLAAALREARVLVTADRGLLTAALAHPLYGGSIRALMPGLV